jgi:hypothetical protein
MACDKVIKHLDSTIEDETHILMKMFQLKDDDELSEESTTVQLSIEKNVEKQPIDLRQFMTNHTNITNRISGPNLKSNNNSIIQTRRNTISTEDDDESAFLPIEFLNRDNQNRRTPRQPVQVIQQPNPEVGMETTLQMILREMTSIKGQNKDLSDQITLGSKHMQEIVEKTNADLKEEVLGVIEGKVEEVKTANQVISDKVEEVINANQVIANRVGSIEERHAEYDRMIRKMIGDNEGNDKRSLTSEMQKMMLTDAEILTEENGVSWHDLVSLDSVKGWQEEYQELLRQARNENQGEPMLPKLTAKIELGIKATTQRMHE